jgi:hypothetical protein
MVRLRKNTLRLLSAAKPLRVASGQIAFGFGKKSPMARRDFSRAVPETFAMGDDRNGQKGRWMVAVDGQSDAHLGELSGGGARAYDVAFVTPGPTVDGGRSMVDGREQLYRICSSCAARHSAQQSPLRRIWQPGRQRGFTSRRRSRIFPTSGFDGWDIPAGRSAIAEVYPSLWRRGFALGGRTPDQHDAFCIWILGVPGMIGTKVDVALH